MTVKTVGPRILQICEMLEKHGPCSTADIKKLMPDVDRAILSGACQRACRKGLAYSTPKPGDEESHVYAVYPDWRSLTPKADAVKTMKISIDIEEICEIVSEMQNGGTLSAIAAYRPEWGYHKIAAICQDAIGFGLLSSNSKAGRVTYKVVPGWAEIINENFKKFYTRPAVQPSEWAGVSFIFDLPQKWGLTAQAGQA